MASIADVQWKKLVSEANDMLIISRWLTPSQKCIWIETCLKYFHNDAQICKAPKYNILILFYG